MPRNSDTKGDHSDEEMEDVEGIVDAKVSIRDPDKSLKRIQTKIKILSVKDLPTFGGQAHEDANDFMGQFESCAKVHEWDEDLQIKHLTLALVRNARSWLRAFEVEHPKGYEFDAIKNSF